jgi:hypothetical protein
MIGILCVLMQTETIRFFEKFSSLLLQFARIETTIRLNLNDQNNRLRFYHFKQRGVFLPWFAAMLLEASRSMSAELGYGMLVRVPVFPLGRYFKT